jgi:hypothetical protein
LYGKHIEQAKETIVVMGVTSRRFLEDFAAENSPLPGKTRLVVALKRGVAVKILVASNAHLEQDQQEGYRITKKRCNELKTGYPHLFDARTFDHVASQSLVRFDNEVIVGPVFPGKESRHTPAIHLSVKSHFAQSYLDNFDNEWGRAKPLNEG